MWALFFILGVVAEIVKANNILIIPNTAEYILFGVGGFLLLCKIVTFFIVRKTQKEIRRRF